MKPLSPDEVIVDTREQRPLFKCPPAQRDTLPTGDYSVYGLTHLIAIERKSVADLYGSVGKGRRRFEAAFGRLAAMPYSAVVVEGSFDSVMKAKRWGRVRPAHVLGTMGSWAMKYRVPVFFVGSRTMAKWYVMTLLRLAYKNALKGNAEGNDGCNEGEGEGRGPDAA